MNLVMCRRAHTFMSNLYTLFLDLVSSPKPQYGTHSLAEGLGTRLSLCTTFKLVNCACANEPCKLEDGSTVEPLNKGHFGNGSFVLCSEVVPISEVQLYNPQIMCFNNNIC